MAEPDRPRVIIYQRADLAGARRGWEYQQARARSLLLGYSLASAVVLNRPLDPVQMLIGEVQLQRADAVMVHSLRDFDGRVPAALIAVCDVLTVDTQNTYARGDVPPDAPPVDRPSATEQAR
ncbi:hypothetical protein [Nocardia goodfellowii]|uniref:Resolvase/invertase-type recombinase catalytic domain-containing protein n=1 Tax=Nocardia goodfellowii TaxID=882446 RepID=A0ABS4Q9X5_9NOCA|nr:hypothetical protein [Nocardia goodfellowii]MBP2188493.1 hypothetical protein [Nocardia goodfellowii]